MDETVVEKTDPDIDVVAKIEPSEPTLEPKAKSKGGRPAGAKDKAPRKKKLTIVEEPLVPDPPPEVVQPKPKSQPQPKQQVLPLSTLTFEEPVIEEPPSPRTIMREASKTLMQLKHLSDTARKTHLGDMYTKKLHSM